MNHSTHVQIGKVSHAERLKQKFSQFLFTRSSFHAPCENYPLYGTLVLHLDSPFENCRLPKLAPKIGNACLNLADLLSCLQMMWFVCRVECLIMFIVPTCALTPRGGVPPCWCTAHILPSFLSNTRPSLTNHLLRLRLLPGKPHPHIIRRTINLYNNGHTYTWMYVTKRVSIVIIIVNQALLLPFEH